MEHKSNPWKIPWHLVLIFFFLSAGILVLGYLYYGHQAALFHREIQAQLNAIADLKVKQIVHWRQERMHDAILMYDDPIFASEFQAWLDGQAPPEQKEEIFHRLQGLKQDMYAGIRLLDSQGKVLFAIPENSRDMTPLIKGMVYEAISSGKVIFSDLHLNPEKEIRLDIVVPLHFQKYGQERYVGVVILNVNPHTSLYPLIESWPTPSPTGEFTLVRREGNDIVFLSEMRHRKGAALALRLPLTERHVPAVNAALGKEEILQGVDYNGVPVLAATRTIPDSPWFLTAKIDLSEVDAPIHERFHLMASLMFALIVSAGVGIAYFWRNRDVLFYRQQYETELERRGLAQRYEYLTKNANDIILLMDRDLKIVEANERALSVYGYSSEEFLRLHQGDLYPPGPRAVGKTPIPGIIDRQLYETVHQRKDGTTFPVAISSSKLEINGDKLYQQIIRDMTGTKEKEKALQESAQQMRYLSSQLLLAQEKERRRISKELHDELGQALMVMSYHLNSIESRLPQRNKQLKLDCQQLLNYMGGVIEKVRRLSWDLSPAVLEELGFAAAIKNLLEEFADHYDIRWSPEEMKGVDQVFSPLAQVNIYRIFQEALTNIGRHAQASQINVSLRKQDDQVSFTVADNGTGFEMNKVANLGNLGRGIGLAAMKERAQLAGGSLEIWSEPGAGTKITFNIPIDQGEASNEALSSPAG